MKYKIIHSIVFFTVCILTISFSPNLKDDVQNYDYLKKRLKNTKAFTIEVMEAMPEATYRFKPTNDVRTYTALASHIVYSIEWNIHLMKGTPIKWTPGDEDRFTKKELLTYADVQFDNLLKFVEKAEESSELTQKIIDVLNHNSHHRGQMVTYLRMKSITPPNYR